MNIKQQFKEGLITNNPVLVQLIGMCATMAITTSLFNGIGMGLSVLVILTCCNVVISLIRKVIPNDIRLAIFVLVIASFVTIVDLLLQAYVPALSASLGVFIPLIVVNCIIIGRAEAFCQKNPVGPSFFDGIFQGLGYTLVLIAMCVIRELLGKGSFGTGIFNTIGGVIGTGNGIQIFPAEYGALVEYKPEFTMRNHFENEINAFVDCVRTGKKLPSHIDTVIITAKMMQAIYDSSEQHKEITLG